MVEMFHFILILIFICIFISVTPGLEHEPGVRRVRVTVGDDVVLPCSPNTNINLEPHVFDWRKSGPPKEEVFMYEAGSNGDRPQSEKFKGRVSHFKDQLKYGNASIKITDVRLTDGGNYTCHFPNLQPPQTYQVELIVGLIIKDRQNGAKPVISTLEGTQDRLLLKCEARGASPDVKLEWQDSAGDVLPAEEPQVTEIGGTFIKTAQITVTQTDRYRCVVTQENIGHQAAAEEFVQICGPPKPSVTILDETHDWSKLQCEVHGAFPQPTLEWQDSAGNILRAEEPKVTERRSSFDIIRQIVVKKTDLYRCVVTQEKILRPTASEIFVRVNEGASAEEVTGLLLGGIIIGIIIGAALLAVLLLVLREKKIITLSRNKASGQNHNYDPAPIEDGNGAVHSEMKDLCRPSENGNGAVHSEMKDHCRPSENGHCSSV